MADTLFFIDREGAQPENESPSQTHSPAYQPSKQTRDISHDACASNKSEDDLRSPGIGVNGGCLGSFLNGVERVSNRLSTTTTAVWHDDDDETRHVDLLYQPRRKKLRKNLEEGTVSIADYAERLRNMNKEQLKNRGLGTWARFPGPPKKSSSDDGDDTFAASVESDDDGHGTHPDSVTLDVHNLLRTAGTALSVSRKERLSGTTSDAVLRPGVLDLHVLTNANLEEPSLAEARCIDFHPSGRILMTAGLDKTVRMFAVDGKRNAKLQSVHIQNFPIYSACFVRNGEEIIASGRRRYFYSVDLQTGSAVCIKTLVRFEEKSWEKMVSSIDGSRLAFTGQHGRVMIVCTKSKREMGQLRHNGRVAGVAFPRDNDSEHELYSCATDGTVYLWDARMMACLDKHRDEGAVHSTCLAASRNFYAVGSDSGVVNVYRRGTLTNNHFGGGINMRTEQPVKSLFNIRTRIDDIAFNGDGQLIAFASHEKKGAVRIAHTASMSVFSNWPSTRMKPSGRVCKLTFSPGGGFLAIGESNGNVQLLRLKAYPAY